MSAQIDPQLVAFATVVGGFSTALAVLVALFAVPTALWQVRQQRRAAYVELFYEKNAEVYSAANELLRLADVRFHKLLEKAKQKNPGGDFDRMIEYVDFETCWERFSSTVYQLLNAYDQAGSLLRAEELSGLWLLLNNMELLFSTYAENNEVPFDDISEFGMFLMSMDTALQSIAEWEAHPGVKDALAARHRAREAQRKRT